MNPFDSLLEELDRWNFDGQEATLWWRDDDAAKVHPLLDQLLEILALWDVPASLAVIPAKTEKALADTLAEYGNLEVLQHGILHRNHAEEGQKKQELIILPGEDWQKNLVSAWRKLTGLFGHRALPVLVPPWNRIDERMLPLLGSLGYRGLSCYGPRAFPQAEGDVWIVNTHVDLVDWKAGRKFVGEAAALAQLIGHLRARREELVDRAEPTGILSHHLVHGEDCFDFIRRLLGILDEHPAVTWLSATRVFQLRWR